jgi:uncharacterized protein YcfJ
MPSYITKGHLAGAALGAAAGWYAMKGRPHRALVAVAAALAGAWVGNRYGTQVWGDAADIVLSGNTAG